MQDASAPPWSSQPTPQAHPWNQLQADRPAALQAAINLCRSSPLPMMVWWEGSDQPFWNAACTSLTDTCEDSQAMQLWQTLRREADAVMHKGQVQQGIDYCLHPLEDQGRACGVLLIGAPVNARAGPDWLERMNYTSVIYSMDLGFCVVELLEEGAQDKSDFRFLEVNPAFERHSGLSNLVGRRSGDVITAGDPFWPNAFKHVINSGRVMHATANMARTQRTVEASIMRLGGAGSRRLAVLIKDITQKQLDSEKRRASEQHARDAAKRAQAERNRLAAVLEATPAAVVVADAHGDIFLYNSQARRIWGKLDVQPRPVWHARWADGGEREGRELRQQDWPLRRALKGRNVQEVIEIDPPMRGDGTGIFLASAAPIWGSDETIEGAVVVAIDITERVMAERALKHASQRKDEFLAMLAHELRNPLAPIAAAAELMGRSDASQESVIDCSNIIGRQVRHLSGLVDDLLDAARVSRGVIHLVRHALDLNKLVHQAIEQSAALLKNMNHQLQLDLPTPSLIIQGDGKRVVQILVNILNNAAKYTPAGGLIHITARSLADHAEIEITDNGIGMDPQTLEQAFDLFVQAERGVDRQQGGLGIGLALVKKLVALQGGQVKAHSDGPGRGSRITLRFRLSSSNAPETPLDGQPPHPAAGSGLRIMVVDDNADAANTLALLLQAWGHDCTVAYNAEQALALATAKAPQVFILDIGLPGMDGKQLAQRLRQQSTTAGACLLALSGYAQAQEQQSARQAGFDHYLVKPVDVQKLLALLQEQATAQA